MIEVGEACDASQMCDAAGMHHGHTDVVDQLFFDQVLRVPNRVEHLADGKRRRGMRSDEAKGFGILRRHRILEPEKTIWLEILAESRRFDRSQAVMHVVQQMDIRTELCSRRLEQLW